MKIQSVLTLIKRYGLNDVQALIFLYNEMSLLNLLDTSEIDAKTAMKIIYKQKEILERSVHERKKE